MAWDHRNKFQEDKPLDEVKPGGVAVGTPPSRRGSSVFTCPGCGVRTCGDMAHCTECGYKLSRKCPDCGAQWRYEYSYTFCPGCGTQLQQRKVPEGQEPNRSETPISGEKGGRS